MTLSRNPETFFNQDVQLIDFNSENALNSWVAKLIEDFKTTINSSNFSKEENDRCYVAIAMLKAIPRSSDKLPEKFHQVAAITLGTLILCMAHNDDRYGKQEKFGNQLLFPNKKLVDIEKIANIKRFNDTINQQILAVGNKALTKEIDTKDLRKILFVKELFPKPNMNLMWEQYHLESASEADDEVKMTMRKSG